MLVRLIDIAQVIRSKNSGPYEFTFDIIFKDWEMFYKFCCMKLINRELIATLYRVTLEDVLDIVEFTPAKAIKITIKRPIPSGSIGDTDVYGAQQHAPFLSLEFEIV